MFSKTFCRSSNLSRPFRYAARTFSSGENTASSLKIDMKGKTVFIAGVGDDHGYGWGIAKSCAEAGAKIVLGVWPVVYPGFVKNLQDGVYDDSLKLSDGSKLVFSKVYPLDVLFDTKEDVPEKIATSKKYKDLSGYTIQEVVDKTIAEVGTVDYLVHSVANGPEVSKGLLEVSRSGYLGANSASAFSMISLVQRFAPHMSRGGSVVSLSYIAAEKVIPGYGGGMSSAKAALESDTRVLAFEAGRKYGIRVNSISAGPFPSRAAKAIKKGKADSKSYIDYAIDYEKANAPLPHELDASDVGNAAAFLLSPLSNSITGVNLHVDCGLHAMGTALDSISLPYSGP